MRRFLAIAACQAAAGLVFEALARWLDWWRFPALGWIALQVLLFWGLVMGAMTLLLAERHPALRYLAGVLVGGGAELLNYGVLGLWSFPDGRVWSLGVPVPGLLALALAWGLLPLLTPMVYRRQDPRRS